MKTYLHIYCGRLLGYPVARCVPCTLARLHRDRVRFPVDPAREPWVWTYPPRARAEAKARNDAAQGELL